MVVANAGGQVTDVVVDQRTNGGSYQLLGAFSLDAGDTISLSNDADGYVSTARVLHDISEQSRKKSLEALQTYEKLGEKDDDGTTLATPMNAVIPGGRNVSERPMFVYDESLCRVLESEFAQKCC